MRSSGHGRAPCLILTSGDPCGIGPEVILKALDGGAPRGIRIIVVGDRSVFESTARRLRLRGPALFVDCGHRGPFRPGRSSAKAGAASLAYLRTAIAISRRIPGSALVTGPVTKWAVEESGEPFVGHTEYLAQACGARRVVMMFVSARLRLVLLTRHLALRRVSGQVTAATLRASLILTAGFLRRRFGIAHPRLAICGLNPHAGERGRFGDEEQRIFGPVLARLRRGGLRIDGPFSADGFFGDPRGPAFRLGRDGGYDAVACCYHDQGLIPFKLVARDRGAQVTVGLPIVRTAPDHGSGLDIAGAGTADPGSMRYAIRLAAQLISAKTHIPHSTGGLESGA